MLCNLELLLSNHCASSKVSEKLEPLASWSAMKLQCFSLYHFCLHVFMPCHLYINCVMLETDTVHEHMELLPLISYVLLLYHYKCGKGGESLIV